MEETLTPTPSSSYGGFPCIFAGCDNSTSSCTYTCFTSIYPWPLPPLPSPPPPPPSPPSSSQNHMAPFLIATICILGISFLLLSTCTVILRLRFTGRRRVVAPENPDDSAINVDHSVVDHPIWHITTVGLQQSVIDSITAFKYKKIDGFFVHGSDTSCSVCLTEFDEGDDLRLLPKCSHAFHISCIDTWLRSHKNCPLCRAPVVNEIVGGNSGSGQLNSNNSGSGQEVERVNLDDNNGGFISGEGEGSNHQLSERRDDLGELPMIEGIKIAEILKKNRELRILSDLGEHHRFRGDVQEGFEPVRRSISFNGIAAPTICGPIIGNEGCSKDGSFEEGCSKNGDSEVVLQEQKIDIEKGGGQLMKSASIGRLLQKGPISMKRSLSSSSKFFSFRRTKSQASILPL